MITNFEQLFERMQERGLRIEATKATYKSWQKLKRKELEGNCSMRERKLELALRLRIEDDIDALFSFGVITAGESQAVQALLR